MGEKLTYYLICSYAAMGMFDKIPSGYNIKWVGEEPTRDGNKISCEVDGDKIIFTRNECPRPTKLIVKGSIAPRIPDPYLDDEITLVEYGDVYIPTEFTLNGIYMIFDENTKGKAMEWSRRALDSYRFIPKAEITFDMRFETENEEIRIYTAIFGSFEEEGRYSKAELACDYFEVKPKTHQES